MIVLKYRYGVHRQCSIITRPIGFLIYLMITGGDDK